jgi:hypothetical protein
MDATAIMPIERRGKERNRIVFGVLKCHGIGLADCGVRTLRTSNDGTTKIPL